MWRWPNYVQTDQLEQQTSAVANLLTNKHTCIFIHATSSSSYLKLMASFMRPKQSHLYHWFVVSGVCEKLVG